jgi:sulfate permease, SulP family
MCRRILCAVGFQPSIVLSLLHSLYIIARPGWAVLARVPGTTVWWNLQKGEPGEHEPGVLVFAPGAPINFTNAEYVRGRLMDSIAAMDPPCRLVVIEAHGVSDIDFTGSGFIAWGDRRSATLARAPGHAVAIAALSRGAATKMPMTGKGFEIATMPAAAPAAQRPIQWPA